MEIKEVKKIHVRFSAYAEDNGYITGNANAARYEVISTGKQTILDYSDDFEVEGYGFGDLNEKLKDYLNTNTSLSDDASIYCMKGHNITKLCWETLKAKGYSKTISIEKADYIAWKPENIASKLFDYTWRSAGSCYLDVICPQYISFSEDKFGSNTSEATEAKKLIEAIKSAAEGENHIFLTFENDYYISRAAPSPLLNVIDNFKSFINSEGKNYLNRIYIKPNKVSELTEIIDNKNKLIDQQYVIRIASEEKKTMDFNLFKEINQMLKSTDKTNRLLANRLIVSCNPVDSYAYLLLLFYLHSDHFYNTKDDFRDSVSKSFINEYNRISGSNSQTRVHAKGSINSVIESIKKQNQFTDEVANICLTIVRNEIIKNLNYYHINLIDEIKLRNAIVLK